MQKINLELNHNNFFCPVTGTQIMSDENFIASQALKFCYIDNLFIFISDDLKPIFTSLNINVNVDPLYVDFDMFESIEDKLKSNEFILFKITNSGIACGPISTTTYYCIDMNFIN